MGQIDFFKLYRLSVEECYEFPGDYAFGKYLHPQGSVNRGDLLIELHGDRQAPRFFSEAKVQTETILHAMMQVNTHMARVCVLNVLDRYFFMDGVRWRDGAVVDQKGLQLSDTKLTDSTVPCLGKKRVPPWFPLVPPHKNHALNTTNACSKHDFCAL